MATADTSRPTRDGDREIIDMASAIELLKTTRSTFYRWLRSGKLKGMKVGRQWRFYRDEIERFMAGEEPRIALPADPQPLLDDIAKVAAKIALKGSTGSTDLPPVDQAINTILRIGVQTGASDVHFTLHPVEQGGEMSGVLRWRIDGILQHAIPYDSRLQPAIIERLKQMAACNVHERVRPQDGRVWLNIDGRELDLRISFTPAIRGEIATIRILDSKAIVIDLDRFRMTKLNRGRIDKALAAPNGTIFVTGPTGSGKTTTLYACLNQVARPDLKVLSVEDPVEYILPWITQVPVRHGEGVTFAHILRSFLRSDPDVILVGEVRDLETAQVCVQAALTGHLVLSTLHTDEAASALTRLMDIGLDPFLVSDSLRLVVAQRLARMLCPHCRRPAKPPRELLVRARKVADSGGLDWDGMTPEFHEPVGCDQCGNIGYRGRTALMETLRTTPAITEALRERADVDRLRQLAVADGMITMAADGVARAAAGETTLSEVFRVFPNHGF